LRLKFEFDGAAILRLKAYVMAADPSWIEQSVMSYYDLIEELVVCYDKNGIGWTGEPIPVQECLERLQKIDFEKKIRLLPGDFARPKENPCDSDTYQRQVALDAIGDSCDWVIQFDTDEVLGDKDAFLRCLKNCQSEGFAALDYPARWLYRQVRDDLFLERSSRVWQITANYPGPVAVRPNMKLLLCRQCEPPPYRVDFKERSTDPLRSEHAKVHEVIDSEQGVWHFAWVRDESTFTRKSKWSTHSRDFDWSPEVRRWFWCGRHPYLAAAVTPLMRKGLGNNRIRLTRVPQSVLHFNPNASARPVKM